jgi:hypothetical protein
MRVRVVLIALVATMPFVGTAQTRDSAGPKVAGGASISGTVVSDEQTSHPIRRAIVTVSGGTLRGGRQTVTDDLGRFQFNGLPGGEFTLSATKAGWLNAYYGSTRPGRPPSTSRLNLNASGAPITGLTLRMLHGGAIAGTVVDQNGRPADVSVQVHQVRVDRNGRRVAIDSNFNASISATEVSSDDRGTYRLYGLPPGDYVVVASSFASSDNSEVFAPGSAATTQTPSSSVPLNQRPTLPRQGQSVAFADVYFPGTTDPNAATIVTLGPAEERAGVNFALQLVPTARVSGTLVGPDGQPPANGNVLLIPHAALSDGSRMDMGFLGSGGRSGVPDGKFSIPSVPPGDYTILARGAERSAMPPAAGRGAPAPPELGRGGGPAGVAQQTLFAATDVSVNGQDVSNLSLSLQRGPSVSGRLRFDGATTAPDSPAPRVGLIPMGPIQMSSPPVQVSNGTFTFPSMMPGRYRVTMLMLPSGWQVASVSVGGIDVTDTGFDVRLGENITDATIRLTDRISEISGVLQDQSGKGVTDRVVVAFPVDPALWTSPRRMRPPVNVDRDGAFRIRDVPPGDYWIAVATDLDQDDLADTRLLEQLAAAAVKLTIAEGDKKVQNLVVR